MREHLIQTAVMAVLNSRESPCRVWRNNVGGYYDARGVYVSYGLAKGSADLIGLVQVTITPEMVGRTVALFLSDEIKAAKGRLSPEQEAWERTMGKLHAVHQLHRSEEEAREFLRKVKDGCLFSEAA